MRDFKEKVVQRCAEMLKARIEMLTAEKSSLTDSMTSETKSPLGDKHETARARMQAEADTVERQLADANEMLESLLRLNLHTHERTAFSGSLIETDRGTFFISVPLGKVIVDEREVHVISPQAPIGKLFTGAKAHDEFAVNGMPYRIISIS